MGDKIAKEVIIMIMIIIMIKGAAVKDDGRTTKDNWENEKRNRLGEKVRKRMIGMKEKKKKV